jgi:hypothetical protein
MANFLAVDGSAGQPEIEPEPAGQPEIEPEPAGQREIEPELHDVAQVVHQEFDQQLDPSAVDDCLQKVVSRFEGAKIRSFIPLLVGRYVREELRTLLRQSSDLPGTP